MAAAHGTFSQYTCNLTQKHESSPEDMVKASVIITVTVLIIVLNLGVLVVACHKKVPPVFAGPMRYFVLSLVLTDLGVGLLVAPFCVRPALQRCWMYSQAFCQVQALLIAALFHLSTLSIVALSLARALALKSPFTYERIMTKRNVAITLITMWVLCFTTYAVVIFRFRLYYFDTVGVTCEPFYDNRAVTLSVISVFYVAPAAVLLTLQLTAIKQVSRVVDTHVAGRRLSAVRSLLGTRAGQVFVVITLAFFLAISPWTICTVLMSLGVEIPEGVDFTVTWLALSNSFWNPLIYGLGNRSVKNSFCNTFKNMFKRCTKERQLEGSTDRMETVGGLRGSRVTMDRFNRDTAIFVPSRSANIDGAIDVQISLPASYSRPS